MLTTALKLSEHCRDRPKGVTLHMTAEFRKSLKDAAKAIAIIERI
jgi:hypothetical protein